MTNRKPSPGFEIDLDVKAMLHNLRMKEIVEDEMEELTEEQFMETYDTFAKNKREKYEFIYNAGSSLKPALWNLCRTAWRTEQIPEKWC